jgi:YbgC/YbaW family acyl-CoA thioester hydrolase
MVGEDMSRTFTRTFRVRWSEINAAGQVHLSEYFRYVIETAWDWGATIGLSIRESEELGLAWVLHEAEIHLYRPLHANDTFELTIWLVDWRRVRGTRCFEIVLKDSGELVAQGTQEVVSLDLKSMRPVATPDTIIDSIRLEDPRVFPHQKIPKFQLRPEVAFVMQKKVEWRDLDSQEHVNNANYVAFAEDAVAQALAAMGWPPASFQAQSWIVSNPMVHIQYQSPASWGETLEVVAYLVELKPAGGVWYIQIERAADREPVARCLVEWSLANRINGEEQILPESLAHALKEKLAIAEHLASYPAT